MPHSWWWHTPEDLIEKVDETILVRDARACLHGLWRLLTDLVLPLDYAGHAAALITVLEALEASLGDQFSLEPVLAEARTLRDQATLLADRVATVGPDEARPIDQALMQISRALVPIAYSTGDRFGHDPALPQQPWPVLQPITALASTVPGTDAVKFGAVSAKRARNQVQRSLRRANDILSSTLAISVAGWIACPRSRDRPGSADHASPR